LKKSDCCYWSQRRNLAVRLAETWVKAFEQRLLDVRQTSWRTTRPALCWTISFRLALIAIRWYGN